LTQRKGKMQRFLLGTATCAAAILWFTVPAAAASPEGAVVGSQNLILATTDLDKTVAFYRALGLETADRDGLGRPQRKDQVPAPAPSSGLLNNLCGLTATHDTKFRYLSLKIPNAGFDLELIEFTGLDRKGTRPGNQDPGASTLVLTVRDIDAALAAAKKAGALVVTAGGAPVGIGDTGKTRSVLVRDLDGFFVEFVQPDPLPATTVPASANVIAGSFKHTIQDTDKTLRFYRDVLGFDPQPGTSFFRKKSLADLVGLPAKVQFRISMADVPGSSVHWDLVEFKDTGRKPYHPKTSDPGAPVWSLRVRDVDAALKAVKDGGGVIATIGGEPVKVGPGRNIFVRDPDGFLLELAQNMSL
jgi:catechol 2,3-dioxygenase-like lactoylglutathione lyase family enzyme